MNCAEVYKVTLGPVQASNLEGTEAAHQGKIICSPGFHRLQKDEALDLLWEAYMQAGCWEYDPASQADARGMYSVCRQLVKQGLTIQGAMWPWVDA